ncbi:PEP-CTERM/exosortase system-associated acyltransferase [Candidatus Methylobacter favarea]|uniref:PEP-CTERM/exosortase system-associated acyltransferase n=1 Tax=Candidatus Methylobacter favarea TaxID=2707345 RepID=A0A8S0XE20_9GAMM|nr:PEP-CTERM/exosortase system-associated acyltransferase [Candidatus Methylobacter favarea]CAA9889382.1 PEP-CTERM/exosortase system-associated acyltransferase [Candidatus Methylobacter favarea]
MFDKHFEVFLADTPESKKQHYGIRYQVYCEEMGFENKHDFPTEQEIDKWDQFSVHFIVRARHTRQWVGAMRMVFNNEHPLPLEQHGIITKTIDNNAFDSAIEISRLCLVKEIRRRNVDCDPPLGLDENLVLDENEESKKGDNVISFRRSQQIERSIIWGLFRAAALYSQESNIKKWYFLCTNALARIICKKGVTMKRIGEPCQFKGERIPFEIDLKEILSNSIWLNDYKKGYSLCSEIEIPRLLKEKVASARF